MKRTIIIIGALLLSVAILWRCTNKHSQTANQLPQDVFDTCKLPLDTFKTWFENKTVTANGVVTAANSVTFVPANNCAFYQWSERMFLWATSPAPGGIPVLASDAFYTISPADSAGNRTLIPNTLGTPIRMASHITKVGPNRLPVLEDKHGNLLEIEKPAPKAKSMVKDANGKLTEVDHLVATGNTFSFIDKAGKTIAHPHAVIKHGGNPRHFVQQFMIGKKPVFLDPDGNIVESEEGQATGDGLIAQNGSLVYYVSFVNDFYAAYLNMVKTSDPAARKKFPTDTAERDSVVAFAKANGIKINDPNTLAMELKTSWIEASKLGADSSNYVLMTAIIPTFDTTNNKKWVPNGEKTARMAMVGLHIAGSVTGHPEMVWATFEQQSNTPDTAFSYLNSKKDTVKVSMNTSGKWLFTASNAVAPFNESHMLIDSSNVGDTIYSKKGRPIGPSNTLRTTPWGGRPTAGAPSNPENVTSAASNSEVIAVNNSVRGQLASGDIRANYLFIGAVWTPNGTGPTGNSYNGGGQAASGTTIGTTVLANSTMETYFQSTSQSCFSCHSGFTHAIVWPDTISHMFSAIQTFGPSGRVVKKKK